MAPSTGSAVHDYHFCSRKESRQARQIIAQRVYPYLGEDAATALEEDCLLHPDLDMYKHQELHKSLVPGKTDTFQCGYCGKQFRTEFYMDRHMDNKHADRVSSGGVGGGGSSSSSSPRCLADLCGVLGCGEYATVSDCGGGGGGKVEGCGVCDERDMGRRKLRCKSLFHRCFDPSGAHGAGRGNGMEALRDFLVDQFCEHLGCDEHHRPLPPPPPGSHGKGPTLSPGGIIGGSGGGMGKPRLFLVVVVMLALVVFYGIMGVVLRSRWTKNDLRPAALGRGKGGAAERRDLADSGGVVGRGRGGELRQRRTRRSLD